MEKLYKLACKIKNITKLVCNIENFIKLAYNMGKLSKTTLGHLKIAMLHVEIS